MDSDGIKNTDILQFIIENSLITHNQLDIICKRLKGELGVHGRSKGAYYRLLKQSRAKIRAVIYSLVLIEFIGLWDINTKEVLKRLAQQINVTKESDVDEGSARDVIHVMDELVKRLSKV